MAKQHRIRNQSAHEPYLILTPHELRNKQIEPIPAESNVFLSTRLDDGSKQIDFLVAPVQLAVQQPKV